MTFPPPAWEQYQRHRGEIEGLLDPRCHSIEWLDLRLLNGPALAFGNDDAVVVVEIKDYPAGAKEVHGLVAAGSLPGILELIEKAEAYGIEQGCDFASIASRAGWERVLAGRGYAPYQTEIRKELR